MWRYVFRRILASVPVVLGLLLFTFLLIRFQPGGPFDTDAGGFPMPEARRVELMARYGLDDALPEQFVRYVAQVASGDLGPMLRTPYLTVRDVVSGSLPITLQLAVLSILFGLVIGLPIGIFAAIRHNRLADHIAMFLAIIGVSIPTLTMAPVLVILLGLKLGLFPIAFWGADPPFVLGMLPPFELEFWRHAALPVFAIGVGLSAGIARLTRASLLEVLGRDYIRTARAKGVPQRSVINRHALKNALIPVVTLVGPLMVAILPASIVVETIFAINGLGRNIVASVRTREYFLLSSGILVYGVLLIASNLVTDLIYAWLDPRIQYGDND